MLPPNAPVEWNDRETLWNAVEAAEIQKDSRLAREFNAALPIELDLPEWKMLLTTFIHEQFVSQGMCADVVIHNPGDEHNPHAHIMLTVRPLKENGEWASKTEKEYLCVRDGEERGFTATEFKEAKLAGWEKQYPYIVGDQKIYMTAAEGEDRHLKRASKYPKCTRYGRQNPIAERWNSEEQFVTWRAAWADAVNAALERNYIYDRVDHRSNADRGIEDRTTIHEGVIARALERKGVYSDRCELNRQIKEENQKKRAIKAEIKWLEQQARNDEEALAAALEQSEALLIGLRYQILSVSRDETEMKRELERLSPALTEYHSVMKQLKPMVRKKAALRKELDTCVPFQLIRKNQLNKQIDELEYKMEPYIAARANLLRKLGCKDDKAVTALEPKLDEMRRTVVQLTHRNNVLNKQYDDASQHHKTILERVTPENRARIEAQREMVRKNKREDMKNDLMRNGYGTFDPSVMEQAVKITEESIRKVTGQRNTRNRFRGYER